MAGPPTSKVLPPAARVWSKVRAISRMAAPLGFSVETLLSMKAKVCRSRGRCSGNTRTPAWPVTIASPRRTSVMGTQRAAAAAASTRMPQSISWSATGTHCPARRTSVRWLVVL